MSLEEFKAYLMNRGVNFDELSIEQKKEWSETFDRSRLLHLHKSYDSGCYLNSLESWASVGLPSRKRPRWDALNALRSAKAKKMTLNELDDDSRAFSNITWNEVKNIYKPFLKRYEEDIKLIPEDIFNTLFSYLNLVSTCVPDLRGKEAKRMYFICPIIVAVCSVFKGEVAIMVEEDLTGSEIRAHGHFEIILERGDKKICIVVAKRDDMEQGLAQRLLGCEVISDLEKTDVVYGIVTTYQVWNVTRFSDEKIEEDEMSLEMHANFLLENL